MNVRVISFAAALISLLAVGILLYTLIFSGAVSEPEAVESTGEPDVTVRPPFKESREAPPGFDEYRSVFYRFQLLYPESLTVREFPEPVSAMTLDFQSQSGNEQFQIFIIPHGDPHITEFRLSEDLPSGIMEAQEEIDVAGVRGTAFVSRREGLDETREVWFVARGFLYEVTAPIEYDAWLGDIMRTWEFL